MILNRDLPIIGLAPASEATLEPPAADVVDEVPQALRRALASVQRAGIRYCAWRQTTRMHARIAPLEVLIGNRAHPSLIKALAAEGFEETAWDWPVPARFFQAGEQSEGTSIPLAFSETVHYGPPPCRLPDAVARSYLGRARPVYGVYRPSPDDAMLGLLLECVLEWRRFGPAHRRRLEALLSWPALIDDLHLSQMVDQCFHTDGLWDHIHSRIFSEDFDGLLELRPHLHTALGAASPRNPTSGAP